MRWLDGGQRAVMEALDHGPAYLPDNLFTGSAERVLAGMKVHANTISHARLVALEETFPRTRAAIGHDRFNQHSRLFLLEPGVTGQSLPLIGEGFSDYLRERGEGQGTADLARFEWLWLQAYHAADAEPLALAELAGLAPEALLDIVLLSHPAAIAVHLDRAVHDLIGAEVEGLAAAEAVLITRPESDVLVSPADNLAAELLEAARIPSPISNLLTIDGEEAGETAAAMAALVSLINAGALVRANPLR
jgi:hypothetical protein